MVNTVNMKDKITQCARDIYLEQGYSGLSMRKIAECANISATAIYRHFPNKEALLFNVLLTGFREFSSYLKRCETETIPLKRLLHSCQEYMNFALEHSAYYEIMFMNTNNMTGLKSLNQKGAEEMQATYLYHHQLVKNCHFKDQNTGENLDQLVAAIWAFNHGFVSLYLAGQLPLNKESFISLYKEQINNYLTRL